MRGSGTSNIYSLRKTASAYNLTPNLTNYQAITNSNNIYSHPIEKPCRPSVSKSSKFRFGLRSHYQNHNLPVPFLLKVRSTYRQPIPASTHGTDQHYKHAAMFLGHEGIDVM